MVNSMDRREVTRVLPRKRANETWRRGTNTPGCGAEYSHLTSRGRGAKAGRTCGLAWSLVLRGRLPNGSDCFLGMGDENISC